VNFSWWRSFRERAYRPRRQPRYRPQVEGLEDRRLLAGNMVLHWNSVALDTIRADYAPTHFHDQGGPTRDSRVLAIVQTALYDAVDTIVGGATPYLVHVHAAPGASLDAAIAQAGHDTLRALYPHQGAPLDQALATSLAPLKRTTSATDIRLGAQLGHDIAAQLMIARQHDGSAAMPRYTPGTSAGQWMPDPNHPNQAAFGVVWGKVKPFMMTSDTQFHVPPPPPLHSKAYAQAFNEVKALGADGTDTPTTRTAEQTQIALFWAYDNQPGIGSPPIHYNEILQTIARQQHNTEAQDARLFALANMAMADAGMVTWNVKYTYNLWRPVTGIREAATDGNPATQADPTWNPLGSPADNGSGTNFTPPFPSYTSGHSGFGAALFGTLRDFYGTDHASFTIGSDEFNGHTTDQSGHVRPLVLRHFTSFSQAAEENAMSRVYLGVHWSFDAVAGVKLGTQVANYVFAHALRPTH
jgi:hypothetical protein